MRRRRISRSRRKRISWKRWLTNRATSMRRPGTRWFSSILTSGTRWIPQWCPTVKYMPFLPNRSCFSAVRHPAGARTQNVRCYDAPQESLREIRRQAWCKGPVVHEKRELCYVFAHFKMNIFSSETRFSRASAASRKRTRGRWRLLTCWRCSERTWRRLVLISWLWLMKNPSLPTWPTLSQIRLIRARVMTFHLKSPVHDYYW